jgi:dipeptide/tripeptide permease
MIEQLFAWLGRTTVGQFLAGSTAAFATVESLHVVALAVTGGVILAADLKVLGVILRASGANAMVDQLRGLFYISLAVVSVSGMLLVAAGPYKYLSNPLFPLKLVLLALALIVHLLLQRRLRTRIDADAGSRVLAASSLVLWSGVVVSGRWLGLI